MTTYRVTDKDSGERLDISAPGDPAETMAHVLSEIFDRSFEMSERDKDGRRVLEMRDKLSDGDVWTASDVAIFTHKTREQVIRMCGARARFQAKRDGRIPIPFKKIDSKTILFDREEIMKWWSKSEPTVLAPMKGRKVAPK